MALVYTYAHYTPQGRLFYIGKGSGRRATAEVGRNQHWHSVVKKYGKPDVQILANWDTQEEAFEHEKILISCFRDLGHKLCNITNGGDGRNGLPLSDEHKQNISLALKGRQGKKPSAETLIKLRQSHLGQKAWNKGMKGIYTQSPMSIAARTKKLAGKLYNVKFKYTGISQDTMESIELIGNPAMKNAGFDPSRIRDCSNGKRKTHKNYTWSKELVEGIKC